MEVNNGTDPGDTEFLDTHEGVLVTCVLEQGVSQKHIRGVAEV